MQIIPSLSILVLPNLHSDLHLKETRQNGRIDEGKEKGEGQEGCQSRNTLENQGLMRLCLSNASKLAVTENCLFIFIAQSRECIICS